MKLLVVDDQLITLNGVARMIDWAAEGFDVVDTAQNAMEARLSFSRGVPDVMLCDIEMPVENGVELCKWVRQQGYSTGIIFLTCHSEFTYAQEAIKLRASDYILQPAPYEEIRDKVRKALKTRQEQQAQKRYQDLGQGYSKKKTLVSGNLWRGYLVGTVSLDTLSLLPNMPDTSRQGWLVLQQLTRWHEPDEGWRKGLLAEALRNFLQDVFVPDTGCTLSSYMEYDTYAIVIQPGEKPLTQCEVADRLKYLANCYDMYMPCSAVFYLSELCDIGAMPDVWERLIHYRDNNSEGNQQICYLPGSGAISVTPFHYVVQKENWLKTYRSSSGEKMAQTALEHLERMREQGTLSRRMLNAFLLDWLETVHSIENLASALDTPEGNTLIRHSVYSAEDMRKLVEYTVANCSVQEDAGITGRIIEYIRANVCSDIRKEDISNLVHLNSDYITRVFKKETGYSIKSYIIREKMLMARQLLQTTSLSVGSVAMQLGYNNFSHFSAAYKKEFGISPGEEIRPET